MSNVEYISLTLSILGGLAGIIAIYLNIRNSVKNK